MIAHERTPEFLFIYLSQGQFCCVDFDAPAEVFNRKWYYRPANSNGLGYAVRNIRIAIGQQRQVLMHRVILGLTERLPFVDHRNHVGIDNRRSNLRTCTAQENSRNARRFHGNSKFKGVYFNSNSQKFHAMVRVKGKCHFAGQHTEEEAAARAYDAAALKYHGDFACLNFPLEVAQ